LGNFGKSNQDFQGFPLFGDLGGIFEIKGIKLFIKCKRLHFIDMMAGLPGQLKIGHETKAEGDADDIQRVGCENA
jgi:hypothetical protein